MLPRSALREDQQVLVLAADGTLRFREVEVVRLERETVVLGSGLEAGERVCTTPLAGAIDGMAVRVAPTPVAEGALLGSRS